MADFFLRKNAMGYESASSAASSAGEEDSDNAVALPTDYVGRNNKKGERRAVRLDEIGPRMELRLVKIVEGAPGKEGSVIHHQFGEWLALLWLCCAHTAVVVKKSKSEVVKQKAEHAAKERLRKQRREEQERNVKRKKVNQEKNDRDDEAGEDDEEEHDEGEWDDEEEISDGDDDDEAQESSQSEQRPHPKRRKG